VIPPGIDASGVLPPKGTDASQTFSFSSSLAGSGISVKLTYNQNNNSSAIGYLNYLTLNVPRDLTMNNGSQWGFRSIKSLTAQYSQYDISNAGSNLMIWEVTNPVAPVIQKYTLSGSTASFTADSTALREFVAFTSGITSGLTYEGRVANQNLHGINSPDLPDMVIVTDPAFVSAANRLALFRKSNDNLDVAIVTTNQVYNEFSSGAQDVSAIRYFMRALYLKKTATDSVRFLLLFGDCSFDYKNRLSNNTNFVPIYESRESLNQLSTYSSDDYFALLDPTEGNWTEPASLNELMDMGVGRIPCKSAIEADGVVNKIIHYHTSLSCLGKWRNRIGIVSDDEENNGSFTGFMYDADSVAKSSIEKNFHHYNVSKIYMDAYTQVSSPDGEQAPQVAESIQQEIQKGLFMLNYVGHGGESQWAQENILNMTEIIKWDNYDKLPFLVTATCDFGRYDDPAVVSGGEYVVVSDHNGGIGILTSARPVYQNSNFLIYKNFYANSLKAVNGKMPTLGEIVSRTKNASVLSVNNRNYSLLGDPSMVLEYPSDSVVITKINNIAIAGDTIKAKALSKVNFQGEIRDPSGAKLTGYNGVLHVTVYDQPSTIHTVTSLNATFKALNNFIYEGTATVSNGDFTVNFMVPKDISYQNNFGKISFYSEQNQSTNDASGNFSRILIGGTSASIVPDNTPPVIRLFMQDSSFVFGGVTNSNTTLIAKLSDANGINVSIGGIGHEITGVLDNGTDVLVLNDYYSANIDDYTKGTLTFPIKGLSPGNHSLRVKAWDTYNNSSEAYIEFVVTSDEELSLRNVLNYPNPFSTHTNFHFDHNRSGDDVEVLVSIYTVSGTLIKTLDEHFYASESHISGISWDGRDDFGDKIGKGVYIYKLNVRSLRDGSNNFKYQKLVILN
ncbi:MAG: type IX secretion system sortase PorU, partial [Cytophagaceae bacterium]